MNAKKKNKKANKPPNRNPPQSTVSVSKKEEKIDELTPKCEVTDEKLPVEVISEVADVSVSNLMEIESETPKKPKRNKDKNIKQDKEEKIEVQETPQKPQTEFVVKEEESLQKNTIDDKGSEEKEDSFGEPNVVPSARKKKNKKKMQEKPIEEMKQESKTAVGDNITSTYKEDPIESIEKIDTEIQELFSSTPEIPKQEGKKKKNKKKNRTDSEKSDRSDNILSCTSAFQNILAENASEIKQFDETVEVKELLVEIKSEKVTANTDSMVASNVETKLEEEIKQTNINLEDTKELSKIESKGKKKNKKDKKQQQKEIVPKQEISEEITIPAEIVLNQNIFSSDPQQDIIENIQMPLDKQEEKELSPKPKAKIAKPVEKKKKDKLESESSENIVNFEILEIKTDENKTEELPEETVLKSEEQTVTITVEHAEDQIKQQLFDILYPIENINIPSDYEIGKKRKKSPHKTNENIDKSQELEKEKIKTDVSETKISTEIISDLPSTQVFISESTDAHLKSHDVKSVVIPNIENEPISELSATLSLERSLTPEIKNDNEGFEIKTSKKKKKFPKVPQSEKPEPEVEIGKSEDKKEINKDTKKISQEEATIISEQYLAADITGVQNLATESEAVSCDLIPDILFVRSSSQQMLDNNNNTVIQEVLNVEDITLCDPQLIPLIEGSGATPVRTPQLVSSGIGLSHIESKIPTEEKIDIKSKIIEVNQDMEELRLSIERSLAEFSALENCEKETEIIPDSAIKEVKLPPKNDKERVEQLVSPISEIDENIYKETRIIEPEKDKYILFETTDMPAETRPICPARKDNKGKNKSKKKGKLESSTTAVMTTTASDSSTLTKNTTKEENKEKSEKKSEQKSDSSQEKGKQKSDAASDDANASDDVTILKDTDTEKHATNSELGFDTIDQTDFEPIDNFEDALTSSTDDVNKTFEIIAKNADNDNIEFQKKLAANKPQINITAAEETDTKRNEKVNPVSPPKNLLGHTDIPVQSNRGDYKKEKNKTPNARQAKVKIKDSVDVETKKQSKESQTESKRSKRTSDKSVKETFSRVKNDNEEYVYKYSFRKVFLQSACHVCNKDLSQVRVPCGYCNLIFYCGAKHKDEDWPQHQALCFSVSTLAHMKDQKHIYADAANTTGQDYRLLRMQMIVSCEKVLKRRLVPWEQELMLYPRVCADVNCREWRQTRIKDCEGCGQLSFCAAHPEHLSKSHSRWCKSYSLYQKLVTYQQTRGRLEPRLPTRVLEGGMPGKMNQVLAAMYEEKIDMNDIQYASLTQLATAPLTTAYCLQLYRNTAGITNGVHKKHPFTVHVVGVELQFEADALNKWETFFLHLRPDVDELRVVLVSPQLNPGNLPLDLLGRIKLCDNCQQNKRRLIFKFEDNKNYFEYRSSEDFINPDIICAFNPSIQRSSIYNGKDPWSASVNAILKLKVPFVVTSYTLNELRKDIARIKQVSELDFKFVSEPCFNPFASVRPDRNFISDDEMPLLFKNYCVAVVLGC